MDQELYQKLLDYALRLIAKKRYTSREMENKCQTFLAKKGLEGEDLTTNVIERLRELKYLDDEKYLNDYISDRLRFKPRGKLIIKNELKKKGLDAGEVEEYFRINEVDEMAVALELLNTRMRRWEGEESYKKKEKAARYLASKGFDADVVYKTVNHWYNLFVK